MRRTRPWLLLAVVLPLSLGAGGNRSYFPLEQGNRWHTVGQGHFVTRDLSGALVSEVVVHDDYVRTIDGTEERFGRTYTLLRDDLSETIETTTDESTFWTRYRQDGSGLYEADVDVTIPPGGEPPAVMASATPRAALIDRLVRDVPDRNRASYRASWERLHARVVLIRRAARGLAATRKLDRTSNRGAAENELTRLLYPLHKGQEWQVRPDPIFNSEVEASEHLSLPAGQFPSSRVRIDSILFGPQDRVHFWMSRSGQLAFEYHVETDATDVNGNVIGRTTFDYREELQDFDLAAL